MSGNGTSAKDLAAMTPHEAAAYWFVRRDTGHFTDEERAQLEAWLAASDAHARAYRQAASMWSTFDTSMHGSELRAFRVSALTAAPAVRVWPRALASAAAFLAIAAIGIVAWQSTGERHTPALAASTASSKYVTAHNQRSTVTLPDGSLVSLNLDTVLDTDYSAGERLVRLTRGQAFFEVARDAQRPFIVVAADRRIRALGTKFDVRLEANRVEVVLMEGSVKVDPGELAMLSKLVNRSASVELAPDQRFVARIGQLPVVTPTKAANATSWRDGWLVFEDSSLGDAIDELNRYSDTPIVGADDAVRRLRLSGVFRIGQPDRFGAIIEELLPVSAERGADGEIMLVSKPSVRRDE
jgi:transmembrane sensor